MVTQHIATSVSSDAPIDAVWEVIADATRYADWSKLDSASYEREGTPAPHGTGAIRLFGSGKYTLREQVTAFAPESHLDYVLLSGMPVRDYRSRISLVRSGAGGTTIHWRAEFAAKIPGTGRLIARKLEESLSELARNAAVEARRRHAARVPVAA